jgi:hypothetical protein
MFHCGVNFSYTLYTNATPSPCPLQPFFAGEHCANSCAMRFHISSVVSQFLCLFPGEMS